VGKLFALLHTRVILCVYMHHIYTQWLKCKIRGGGTLHLGLGPWQWSCAFP